jgi:hypothetical protein
MRARELFFFSKSTVIHNYSYKLLSSIVKASCTLGGGTFEELIRGRYEGPGITPSVACPSKFLQLRDIVTPAAVNNILKGFHQNICKAGDEGIILKSPEGSTRLSLQNFQRTLDVADEAWMAEFAPPSRFVEY